MAFSYTDLLFSIDYYLGTSTKTLTFTDELQTAGYNALGVTSTNVRGLLKIVGPAGIFYINAGYTTDVFTAPDITGATPTWTKASISLPIDSNDLVLPGSYTFWYKITDGVSVYETSKTFNFDFIDPVVSISVTSSCKYSTLTSIDETDYDVVCNSVTYSPSNTLTTDRDHTIEYPITSHVSDVVSHLATVVCGPNIWTGDYNIAVETDLIYDLDTWEAITWFTVHTTVSGETTHNVVCNDCACVLYECIVNLIDRYNALVGTNLQQAALLQAKIFSLLTYWMQYSIANSCGDDATSICEEVQAILSSEGCQCVQTTDEASHEVIPWASSGGTTTAIGTTWYNGTTVPSSSLGIDGDYYLRSTGDVYKKVAGAWVLQFSIAGPTGATGADGVSILYSDLTPVGTVAGDTSDKTLMTYQLDVVTNLTTLGDEVEVSGILDMNPDSYERTIKLVLVYTHVGAFPNITQTYTIYHNTGTVTVPTRDITFTATIKKSLTNTYTVVITTYRSGSPASAYTQQYIPISVVGHAISTIDISVVGQNNDVLAGNDCISCENLCVKLYKI